MIEIGRLCYGKSTQNYRFPDELFEQIEKRRTFSRTVFALSLIQVFLPRMNNQMENNEYEVCDMRCKASMENFWDLSIGVVYVRMHSHVPFLLENTLARTLQISSL